MKPLQPDIQQVVPPAWCADCDVCCRFPEKDSFLSPYFTREEMVAGKDKMGTEFNSVPNVTGCKITLIPYREGYICPAFDPATIHCKIYEARPLDCRLYPFAIMWSLSGKEVLLGMDTKCPFVVKHAEDGLLKKASHEIASALESPPLLDILASNRDIIGRYQEDVIPLVTLKVLTSRIA